MWSLLIFSCLFRFDSGAAVAKEIGISPEELKKTFDKYNAGAKNKNDPFGKKVRFTCTHSILTDLLT